ncbi:MAG: succinate dehydrogenase cytochrome b subunit [Bryobacteraceae bacterium]|nr:succinate dehydrogenase cytochrome b subunit [Bryobacteraceae bacterium]MDW8377266.1 succinate dehydrogenase cytochrome b subunit [Bryobacterales bacterium]
MSAAASTFAQKAQSHRFYDSTIGKKAVMAVTGAILFGFVVVHMLGNLQVYFGPEKINAYGELLHSSPGLLWTARLILLTSVVLHIVAALQLAALNKKARPVGYVRKKNIASTYASRTMLVSGPIIFFFLVYHLLHFTTGQAHPNFRAGDVYHNVIAGFQQPAASIAYIVAMILLVNHLHHGVWSMFQSLGLNHPRYMPWLRRFSAAAAILIGVGNISIPVSVLAGLLQ